MIFVRRKHGYISEKQAREMTYGVRIHGLGNIYGIGKYGWATCGVVESGEMSTRYVSVRL